MDIIALRFTPAQHDGEAAWHLLDGTGVQVRPMMWIYQGASRYAERVARESIDAVAASAVLIELLGGWSVVSELLPRGRRRGTS